MISVLARCAQCVRPAPTRQLAPSAAHVRRALWQSSPQMICVAEVSVFAGVCLLVCVSQPVLRAATAARAQLPPTSLVRCASRRCCRLPGDACVPCRVCSVSGRILLCGRQHICEHDRLVQRSDDCHSSAACPAGTFNALVNQSSSSACLGQPEHRQQRSALPRAVCPGGTYSASAAAACSRQRQLARSLAGWLALTSANMHRAECPAGYFCGAGCTSANYTGTGGGGGGAASTGCTHTHCA